MFHIAAITASELLQGVERAANPRIKDKRQRFVEGILTDYAVLPFGLQEAREHSQVWAKLEQAGQMIGSHDIEIAATALAADFLVATLNREEFDRIPGITLIDIRPFVVTQIRRM